MTAPMPTLEEIAEAQRIANWWHTGRRPLGHLHDEIARALAAHRVAIRQVTIEECETWHADEAQSHHHDGHFNSSDHSERIRHLDWAEFHAECAEHFRALARSEP